MRRKHLTILFALPTANALSLANFQQITSVLIPLSCQLTYDGQIPSCTKSDFENGCSTACIAGLNSIAQSVSDSCAEVTVNSNTLLGIVKNGGIVAALCPTLAQTTSTVLKSSTTPIAVSSAAPAVSVTIPTDSQGNTGGLGFKTTTSTSIKSTSIPAPQSIVSTSRSSSVVSATVKSTSTKTTSTTSSTSSTSIESADGGLGGGAAPSTTTTSTSTSSSKKGSVATSTTSSTSKPASQPDAGSGGGSPFDISSSASRIGGDSILGLVILVMACVLTGR